MQTKEQLHPRNRHRHGYNFDKLIEAHPELSQYVVVNKYASRTIDFFDPKAVKTLNAALLSLHYNIEWWDIPSGALTPPIPSRADYIHHIATLVGDSAAHCLDVGVGASCIYPIIGCVEYNWSFVGCDIEPRSLENSQKIVERNHQLRNRVELRLQHDKKNIFEGVITSDDFFDITLCNPPFHASAKDAEKASARKLRGLKAQNKGVLNFSGQSNELWCKGGERAFVGRMITQSVKFKNHCRWFTSLVSSESNLSPLLSAIERVGAAEHRIIEMAQGNKRSRILAWRF